MTPAALAQQMAVGLTRGAWTRGHLTAHLERHLPRGIQDVGPYLAAVLIADFPQAYAPAPKALAKTLRVDDGFARLYAFCRKHNAWPRPDLAPPTMAPVPPFDDLPLPDLPTPGALADWLAIPVERLSYMADPLYRYEENGETAINHYHYMTKPKRSGGLRVIEAPKVGLKGLQRQILRGILDHVPVHEDAFGFVPGRNCRAAAARHVGEPVVICFDLAGFFPSVPAPRIFGLFRRLGYPHAVARHLTALCTNVTPSRVRYQLPAAERPIFRTPHLPQGAPTSPALANHAAFALDCRLSALARNIDANFSRYADDLSFSGGTHLTGILPDLVPKIVADEGFAVNPSKTRIARAGARQVVTGIVVNRHLNVRRADFDRLKAVIHACGKPGNTRLSDPAFRLSLIGQVDWVTQVNPARGRKLHTMLARVLD